MINTDLHPGWQYQNAVITYYRVADISTTNIHVPFLSHRLNFLPGSLIHIAHSLFYTMHFYRMSKDERKTY
jgi:hypothetical protein